MDTSSDDDSDDDFNSKSRSRARSVTNGKSSKRANSSDDDSNFSDFLEKSRDKSDKDEDVMKKVRASPRIVLKRLTKAEIASVTGSDSDAEVKGRGSRSSKKGSSNEKDESPAPAEPTGRRSRGDIEAQRKLQRELLLDSSSDESDDEEETEKRKTPARNAKKAKKVEVRILFYCTSKVRPAVDRFTIFSD